MHGHFYIIEQILDTIAFFLVTTDLYGAERLRLLSHRITAYFNSIIEWFSEERFGKVVIIGTISLTVLAMLIMRWVLRVELPGEKWVNDLSFDQSLLSFDY